MVSLKVSKPDALEDIKKNTWLIDSSKAPHLAQHRSPCSPLACKFFLLLYTLTPIAIKNVWPLVDTVLSSNTLSIYQLWIQKLQLVFPCPSKFFLLGKRIWPCRGNNFSAFVLGRTKLRTIFGYIKRSNSLGDIWYYKIVTRGNSSSTLYIY